MYSIRKSLQRSRQKLALRLFEKQSTRSMGEKLLVQQTAHTLYTTCQYFVNPEDPLQVGRVYLGMCAVSNEKPQNISFGSEQFRFEPLHTFSPSDVGLQGNDEVAVSCVTLRRVAGNRLRIWLAPNRVGKGMNLRTIQYSGPVLYLYELQPNGKTVGDPGKLYDRSLYIKQDTAYLLTDEKRSFTLKFICSGHCHWQVSAT